jgi:hypothetical protein
MLIFVLSASAGLAFFALRLHAHYRSVRHRKLLQRAHDAGVSIDNKQIIDAEMTLAGMLQHEEDSGERFTGRKACFMKLMRVVAEGPKNPDEIRFLFAAGIDPVVRPDGMVYVPCIENEHLSVAGEIELQEEDLDRYLAQEYPQHMADQKTVSQTIAQG